MSFGEETDLEQGKQNFKYNGKELDKEHGLNQYDYPARFMDTGMIRFTTVDPHPENYLSGSLYVYVGNNPMRLVDPSGKDTTHFEFHTGRIQAIDKGDGDAMSTILPEVTVKGESPWKYINKGGVYKLLV